MEYSKAAFVQRRPFAALDPRKKMYMWHIEKLCRATFYSNDFKSFCVSKKLKYNPENEFQLTTDFFATDVVFSILSEKFPWLKIEDMDDEGIRTSRRLISMTSDEIAELTKDQIAMLGTYPGLRLHKNGQQYILPTGRFCPWSVEDYLRRRRSQLSRFPIPDMRLVRAVVRFRKERAFTLASDLDQAYMQQVSKALWPGVRWDIARLVGMKATERASGKEVRRHVVFSPENGFPASDSMAWLCFSPMVLRRGRSNMRMSSAGMLSIPAVTFDFDLKGRSELSVDEAAALFRQIMAVCSEIDLMPSMVMRTPHGFHITFILKNPLHLRRRDRISPAGRRAKDWLVDIASRLCEIFSLRGLPIDKIASCSFPRFFRMPSIKADAFRFYYGEEHALSSLLVRYALKDLDRASRLVQTASTREAKVPASVDAMDFIRPYLEHLSMLPGAPQGMRNAVCMRLSHAALSTQSLSREEAFAVVRNWSMRCFPSYEGECASVFNSVARKMDRGGLRPMSIGMRIRSEKDRTGEDGRNRRKRENMNALRMALRELRDQGEAEPEKNIAALMVKSGLSRSSVFSLRAEALATIEMYEEVPPVLEPITQDVSVGQDIIQKQQQVLSKTTSKKVHDGKNRHPRALELVVSENVALLPIAYRWTGPPVCSRAS